jgi:hypothetical protein
MTKECQCDNLSDKAESKKDVERTFGARQVPDFEGLYASQHEKK